MFSKVFILSLLLAIILSNLATGQELNSSIGKNTGFPIPRFVSLKFNKVNLRRGPSFDHKIDWVYKRKHFPLKVISEFGHWRKVVDYEGVSGWIYKDLLSGSRYIIVKEDKTLLRNKANRNSLGKAILKKNVIGKLISCRDIWCFIRIKNLKGYVSVEDIWGIKVN